MRSTVTDRNFAPSTLAVRGWIRMRATAFPEKQSEKAYTRMGQEGVALWNCSARIAEAQTSRRFPSPTKRDFTT